MSWDDFVNDLGFKEGLILGAVLTALLLIAILLLGEIPIGAVLSAITACGTVGAVFVALWSVRRESHLRYKAERNEAVIAWQVIRIEIRKARDAYQVLDDYLSRFTLVWRDETREERLSKLDTAVSLARFDGTWKLVDKLPAFPYLVGKNVSRVLALAPLALEAAGMAIEWEGDNTVRERYVSDARKRCFDVIATCKDVEGSSLMRIYDALHGIN